MKLINLTVENFGVLHAFSLDCTEGLNVLCRENGVGKTTLAAFLCAMLYGLPASRKNAPDENDRKKYLPWQGGPFGGSITFSAGGKTYRAERQFAEGSSARRDTFVLYDLSDNSRSDDYSEALGYELFGLDAAAFERSAYLPQRLLSGERANESITARLNRAIGGDSDDGAGLYRTAAAALDRQRQYYIRHGGRGYIADLEQTLADLHEKEYAAMQARADAERYSAEAELLSADIEALVRQKQTLTEARTASVMRAAVLAHGKTLLEHRDAQLSSAAEKRQFLHLDDVRGIAEGKFGDAAIRQAEDAVLSHARLTDRLNTVESHIMRIGEEQERIASLFRDGIPDEKTVGMLSSHVHLLDTDAATDHGDQPLPACFSEEELRRHTEQAYVHAQMTELLAQPKTAWEAYCAAYRDAGLERDDPLPDDDTLQAFADVLGVLAQNRAKQQQLLPQMEETDAAQKAFAEEHTSVPEQQEIVAMRSRFDALRMRTEEIEELEARQRLAVQVHENLRKSRRIRISIGVGLLLAAALLCAVYVLKSDMRMLIAGGVTALPGLLLFVLGLFTRPEESDEARALEDAALKRLCTKKSEYEVEKAAIYEFLDRIGGDAAAVMDEQEAAQRFDAAASAARDWEALTVRAQSLNDQLDALALEEAQLSASLNSYTRSGGGEIDDRCEDRAVFADYRRSVQVCRAAYNAYTEEREARAQAHGRQNALALALDRYLKELSVSCPQSVNKCGDTESGTYTERMAAWSRTADMLRMQMGERSRAAQHRHQAEVGLSAQLDALLADGAVLPMPTEDGTESPKLRAKAVIMCCDRYRILAEERAQQAEQRAALRCQIAEHEQILQAFLDGYFDGDDMASRPTAAEGLQIVHSKAAALAEDMEHLRDAQRQLSGFLTEHGITEEMLTASTVSEDPAVSAGSLQVLESQLQNKTEQRAKTLQDAAQASRIGAELVSVRAQIAHTQQTLEEARSALAIIRKTQECLDAAKTAMSSRYLSYMQARFREYWARLCGMDADAAARLTLDASLAVQTEVLGARRDAAYFSRGTQDCIDFCIRLALVDAMYTDGGTKTDAPHPPLILDDPFVNLDKEHLAAARALLDDISDRFQILYFVCHDSRA